MTDRQNAAVVGAGMAGLACALGLAGAGVAVTVFDKGTRPGGRMATRRTGTAHQFNHGAQFATARDPDFLTVVERLIDSGDMAAWPAASAPDSQRFVGVPGMTAIGAALTRDIGALGGTVLTQRYVAYVHRTEDGWMVRHLDAAETQPGLVSDEGGLVAGPFNTLVFALPAPQAAPLLKIAFSPFAARLDAVRIAPCLAVMLAYPKRIDAPDIIRPKGPLGWIAREGSRPGRDSTSECWISHATAEWSHLHLEDDSESIASDLTAVFARATGTTQAPHHRSVHRWRYALTETPLGEPCLWDPLARLGVCGDWMLGGRIEAAWQSGNSLARAAIGSL